MRTQRPRRVQGSLERSASLSLTLAAFVIEYELRHEHDHCHATKEESTSCRTRRTVHMLRNHQRQSTRNDRARVHSRYSVLLTGQLSKAILHVDGTSVFTRRLYPKVLQQTGVHFFNIPCQTTSWFSRMACPLPSNPALCKPRQCSARERQTNELKCNMVVCPGQELCIPVFYTPSDLHPSVSC